MGGTLYSLWLVPVLMRLIEERKFRKQVSRLCRGYEVGQSDLQGFERASDALAIGLESY
jgi:hypothetical protein